MAQTGNLFPSKVGGLPSLSTQLSNRETKTSAHLLSTLLTIS